MDQLLQYPLFNITVLFWSIHHFEVTSNMGCFLIASVKIMLDFHCDHTMVFFATRHKKKIAYLIDKAIISSENGLLSYNTFIFNLTSSAEFTSNNTVN